MSVIRERTETLEIKMSQGNVLPKRLVIEKGYTYLGSLGTAAAEGYYTARSCRNMKKPVTDEEFSLIKFYAMFKSCNQNNCILDNGKFVRPCLPVFYRGKSEQSS